MVKIKQELTADFNWQVPVVVASLSEGKGAEALFEAHVEDADKRFKENKYLKRASYNPETIIGSNVFLAGHFNELVAPLELRTVVPSDDVNGDIARLVKDRFYTDFNALVVRSEQDSYEINNGLLRQVIETAEQKQGKAKFPFMVEGFHVAPSEDKEYGMKIVPASNFRVIEDERLDEKKYKTGTKFDKVDEFGLPIFDKSGNRNWYAKDDGLSWLILDRYLDLDSSDDCLAYSGGSGRVVLVHGGATRAKIDEFYRARANEIKARIARATDIIDKAYEEALVELKK